MFLFQRNRIRMYPALVNCTTIDLFNEWPQEALLEVGERYLSNVNLEGSEQVIPSKTIKLKLNSLNRFFLKKKIDKTLSFQEKI